MNKQEDFMMYAKSLEKRDVFSFDPGSIPGKLITPIISQEKMLKTRLELRFENIDLKSKTVLDIGAGRGLFSAYAAHKGAEQVIALEPEIEGSSEGMVEILENVSTDYPSINIKKMTFQEYTDKIKNERFDVVISNNSINHLDEEACINLQDSKVARERYHRIFDKLYDVINNGGIFIIADGARRNFWADTGITSPFINLEWHKHQSPKLWISMLQQHGFKKQELIWNTYLSQLGEIGKRFFCNRLLSYFTYNKFVLKMKI